MNAFRKAGPVSLITLVILGLFLTRAVVAQPGVSVPVESFYDELAPYGQWTQHPAYGNVWLPGAELDFQPYASGGHWVVTEYGNTWVSDYAWGWAPFHYGRWVYDPAYGGWLWIPGTDWGPAWVSWRSGGGYYGWAPLGPGLNINVNVNIPAPYWTFVPQVYITSPRLYSYRVPRPNVINIYQHTTIINNVYRSNNRAYVYGPQRVEIERVTRRSVPVYRIDQLDRPGRSIVGNGSVGFYRPNASGGSGRDYGRSGRFDNNRSSGNTNAPNPGYGSAYPGNRRGNYTNDATAPGNTYPTPNRNSRFESSRGAYSPNNNALPNDNPRPAGRSYYERADRQRPTETAGQPQARSGAEGYGRMPEGRGPANPQRVPEQPGQRMGNGRGDFRGAGSASGGRQRGPR